MSKRLIKYLIPSIALTFATQTGAYTINEAVAHALATSPDLLVSVNVREEIDKQLRQAYAGYLPTLDMSGGWGKQYSDNTVTRGNVIAATGPNTGTRTLTRTDFNLFANQMLFDGLEVYHNVEGNKYRVIAEAWRVNNDAQNVAMDVVDAYLNVLLNREEVRIAQSNLVEHERIYGQIKKRSESGIGRRADMDQAEGRVALARTNKLIAEHDLNDAETAYLRQVGIEAPLDLETVPLPHLPACEKEAIVIALHQHPELLASVEDVNVAREFFKQSKAAFSPHFNLELTNGRNHNPDGSFGSSDENSAMIRMTWNLFNGGKDLAILSETAYKMQEAQEVSNKVQRQVVQTVRLAWAVYEYNKLELTSKKLHVDATARTFEAYQKQFSIGQRTLLDVLNSRNELFNAQDAYIRSKYDEIRGAYRLLSAMGLLAESLNVELPVQAEPRPTGELLGAMVFFDKASTVFDR